LLKTFQDSLLLQTFQLLDLLGILGNKTTKKRKGNKQTNATKIKVFSPLLLCLAFKIPAWRLKQFNRAPQVKNSLSLFAVSLCEKK